MWVASFLYPFRMILRFLSAYFPKIPVGFSTKAIMVSFVDALEGLELVLVSPLSFLNS